MPWLHRKVPEAKSPGRRRMNETNTSAPVVPWAYMKQDGEWTIFPKEDCDKLEHAIDGKPVVVNDGHFQVDVKNRVMTQLYWEDDAVPVMRCNWLFETRKGKLLPIPEPEANAISALWSALSPEGEHHFCETIKDHITGRATVMSSAKPVDDVHDMLNKSFSQCTPRQKHRHCKAIHHGFDRWADVAVHRNVQHLVFVVHGIGATYDKRKHGKGDIYGQVAELQANSEELIAKYFETPGDADSILYIPVDWSTVFEEMGDNLHATFDRMALDSIPNIREISNELLSDVPVYMVRQTQVLRFVTNYLNVRYTRYMETHPGFTGDVTVLGHSLGGVISYDLLSMQTETLDDPALKLAFTPTTYIQFGAPTGFFLGLRGNMQGDAMVLPGVTNMFNVFHPLDPVAYRLEPLIDLQSTITPPFQVEAAGGKKPLHMRLQDWADSIGSSNNSSSTKTSLATPNQSEPDADPADSVSVTERVVARMNPKFRYLDFALPAHTSYWGNLDFTYFVVSQVLGKTHHRDGKQD
ncbi:hypothetical protein SPRG_20236 [Saprolegnia parasitica CBS 223.65]|uniref:DDHD domain-containing protein n=1 Tax=Saprolegnia parasitica (strain CBS 223.65) TaxID=695850 RepID=A0A067CFW8_SAPPC|nr:hypothetical protein SPRG_20236 [Saprolegnia parasitica CBS 223.65]KDO28075.1 hypothetical protein SPRG_20236 [Saprolegnia parasitica CBS 223.65]|eukprot:XP_012201222.1 hypothetical protein SPRG_20236 [Saprolegnia parasitica CBS 223.65]